MRGFGALIWVGVPVLVLEVRVSLPGLGFGLLFLSAYFGLGCCGLHGVGFLWVGGCNGVDIFVLRPLRVALGFVRLSARIFLVRGGVPVTVLGV